MAIRCGRDGVDSRWWRMVYLALAACLLAACSDSGGRATTDDVTEDVADIREDVADVTPDVDWDVDGDTADVPDTDEPGDVATDVGEDIQDPGDVDADTEVIEDHARTGEVRGLRAWPQGDTMHVAWRPVLGAGGYILCWAPEEAEWDRVCERVSRPHFETDEWEVGSRWWVDVRVTSGPTPREIVETLLVEVPDAGRPLEVHVTMEGTDLAQLYARDVHSDDLLPAEVRLMSPDGPLLEVVGLRFRGSSSREYPRKGFNIRLDNRPVLEELPEFNFRDERRGAGNRLLLNATWTDPTGVRPAVAFSMYETLGLVASRTFFADLWLQGMYEGFYIGVERIDREAMRRWRLNRREGGFSLFRDQAKANRDLPEIHRRSMFAMNPEQFGESDAEIIALLQQVYDYRGELDDHNWEGLLELLRWVHQTPPGASWEEGLRERFDVDAMLDFMALHILQDDRDSLDIDYWLYRDEDDPEGTWLLIPWDKNLVFGNHWFDPVRGAHDLFEYDGVFLEVMGNRLFARTLATPTLRAALDLRLRTLLDEVFTDAWLDELLTDLRREVERSLVDPASPAFALHPSQHYGDPTFLSWHFDTLRTFWALRRQWLLHERAGGGAPYAWSGEVTLIAGQPYYVQDSSGWVMAELLAEEDLTFDLSFQIEADTEALGVARRWRIDSSLQEPAEVLLSLYYRNRPGLTWLPSAEVGGRDWELTMVDATGVSPRWLPSAVHPFVNRVRASVSLQGDQTFLLLFRDE